MQFLENELREYTQFTWASILDMEVQPANKSFQTDEKNDVSACVQITGSWRGMFVLIFHSDLANVAAEKMFDLEKGKATEEQIRDAAGELINMVGGNLKALVPHPSYLSLPIVATNGHTFFFPSTREVCKGEFNCGDHQFTLTILQSKEKSFLKEIA